MIDIQSIPDALKEGENWPLFDIDPDWLWLARDANGDVVGFLLAAKCHGIVFVWRVKMLPSAPPWALGRLFRSFLRDIRRRGALCYMAMVDYMRPEEQALARIAFRAGAMTAPGTYMLLAGPLETRHVCHS